MFWIPTDASHNDCLFYFIFEAFGDISLNIINCLFNRFWTQFKCYLLLCQKIILVWLGTSFHSNQDWVKSSWEAVNFQKGGGLCLWYKFWSEKIQMQKIFWLFRQFWWKKKMLMLECGDVFRRKERWRIEKFHTGRYQITSQRKRYNPITCVCARVSKNVTQNIISHCHNHPFNSMPSMPLTMFFLILMLYLSFIHEEQK